LIYNIKNSKYKPVILGTSWCYINKFFYLSYGLIFDLNLA
jgi:hypothetical protein